MGKQIELSIVVLCYRAEEEIIGFIEKLKTVIEPMTSSWQMVLVGNYIPGSDDRTKDIIFDLAAKDDRLKPIAKPKEGMMGWDMRSGLAEADGDIICVMDGDGQFPIESIKTGYKLIKEKDLDMVKSYRETRHDGFYRRLISGVYNSFFTILFPNFKVRDANSKPKFFKKEAYQKMKLSSDDWFVDAEIMINVRRYKMKFEEFPVIFKELENRKSFVKVGAILEFIRNLIIYRIREFSEKSS